MCRNLAVWLFGDTDAAGFSSENVFDAEGVTHSTLKGHNALLAGFQQQVR